MISKRSFLSWFICGLLLFVVAMFLHAPLTLTAVPNGILDHQAAGSAAKVNLIHRAWAESGLMGTARIAMMADLVFIGVYGIGAVMGGLYYRSHYTGLLRTIGTFALILGLMFLVTDTVETVLQLLQVIDNAGDDTRAGIAAMMGPPKMASFFFSFFAVIAALLVERRAGKAA